MVDGLTALRDAIRNKTDKNINIAGGFIEIGTVKFPKDVESTWRATGGSKKGQFYKLHDLLFYWQNHGLGLGKYVQKTREAKVSMVNITLRWIYFYLSLCDCCYC